MIDLPTFPMTMYHPVHGAKTVADPAEAATTFTVPHDWFATPAEADAHRTEREAAIVIHKAHRAQITEHEDGGAGVVKHSVTHQDKVDRSVEQAAALAGKEPVETETQGAEILS